MKRKNKPLFPLFTDLSEYKIVVVGGGAVALRRVKTLLHFASDLTVVAPEICGELCALASEGKICLLKKKYEREDLYAAHMVLAATDDRAVNEDIYSACKCLGILVNVASDQNKCDFQFSVGDFGRGYDDRNQWRGQRSRKSEGDHGKNWNPV